MYDQTDNIHTLSAYTAPRKPRMKINVRHTEKLQRAITRAEGRARARTITAADVQRCASKAQERLDALLMRKDQIGQRFICDPHAQRFPTAYNYRYHHEPQATCFELTRGPRGWFMTNVERRDCEPGVVRPQNLGDRAAELIAHVASDRVMWG